MNLVLSCIKLGRLVRYLLCVYKYLYILLKCRILLLEAPTYYLVILGRCLPTIQLKSPRKSQFPVLVLATGCHSWPSPARRFPPYLMGGFYRQFLSGVHFLHFLSHLGPSSSHPQLYLRRNACVDLSGLSIYISFTCVNITYVGDFVRKIKRG